MDDDWYRFDDNRERNHGSTPGYENVLGVAVIPICGNAGAETGQSAPIQWHDVYDRMAFVRRFYCDGRPRFTGICTDIDFRGEVAGVSIRLMCYFMAPAEKAHPCHSDGKRFIPPPMRLPVQRTIFLFPTGGWVQLV